MIARLFAIPLLSVLLVVPSAAQPSQDAYREEGKALGESKTTSIQNGAKETVTADKVPGYSTDNPSQTSYYGNNLSLKGDGTSALGTDDTAVFITGSINSRPSVDPAELATIYNAGLDIERDPYSHVSGYSGTYGACNTFTNELPPSTYERTCNTGVIPTETPTVCDVPLIHSFSSEWTYTCDVNHTNCSGPQFDSCTVEDIFEECPDDSQPVELCTEPSLSIIVYTCPEEIEGLTGTETVLYDGSAKDLTICEPLYTDTDPFPPATFEEEICVDQLPETRIINGVAITLPCWAYQRTYNVPTYTEAANCDDMLNSPDCVETGRTCLSTHLDGECNVEEITFTCPIDGATPVEEEVTVCGDDVYCIDGSCEQIDREADTDFPDAVAALEVINQSSIEFDPSDATVFGGENQKCDRTLFGTKNCCSDDGLLLAIGIGSCTEEEQQLASNVDEGLSTYIGTYCSHKFLGACTKKKKSYCSFASKITRIIREGAVDQGVTSWGSIENPNCDGLSIAQFQQIDLSSLPLDEIANDLANNVDVPSDVDVVAAMETTINAIYANPAANPPSY